MPGSGRAEAANPTNRHPSDAAPAASAPTSSRRCGRARNGTRGTARTWELPVGTPEPGRWCSAGRSCSCSPARARRRTARSRSRSERRRRPTLGVVVPDRSHFESRVDKRGPHVGGPMEVLPVVLAEGAAAVNGTISMRVSQVRARVSTTLLITKSVFTLLAVHDGLGGRTPSSRPCARRRRAIRPGGRERTGPRTSSGDRPE